MTPSLINLIMLVSLQVTECRFTIDHYMVDLIDNTAVNGVYYNNTLQTPANTITTFDASVGVGQEWVFRKHEFNKRIEEGNANIIEKTLRGLASFIIAGNTVAALIRQLPDFKAVGNLNKTPPTGPVKIGTLNNRTVIQDPLLVTRGGVTGPNRYVLGWRGDNFLMAGAVYAPWNSRHYQVTDNENSVTCGKVWSISKYEALRKAA